MTDSDSPLHWKFSQVFGQRHPKEPLQNNDIITTVAFEKRGDFIAVGDRGGRVIIFERDDITGNASNNRRYLEQLDFAPSPHPKFHYKTEFQSHEPEVKEHKVKQVKKMATPLCSENMLLAERSFITGQENKSATNGYHLEWNQWIEKMPQNLSPSQDIDAKIAGVETLFMQSAERCMLMLTVSMLTPSQIIVIIRPLSQQMILESICGILRSVISVSILLT